MKRDPLLIISALLSALGPLVGNGLYAGPTGDDEAVLATLRDGLPTVAYVGIGLELLGFAATFVLLGWLVAYLFRSAPVAAAVVGIAGAAMLGVKLGSAAPIMAAVSLADDLDATTARLLLDLGDHAFVVNGFLTGIAFTAAGAGLLRTSVPRWVAWWPLVAGSLAVLTAAIGIMRPDAYVPIPFLLVLLWMIVVGIRSALASDTSGSFSTVGATSKMTV
jgi:hypothetical protein